MGNELHPDAQALLDVMRAAGETPLHLLSVAQARERMRAAFVNRGEPLAIASVEDVAIPSPGGPLALRLYRPSGGVLPVALFLHGGGWTLNDLDTHDDLCRRLARRSGWMVASLDYRRAPEHKYPAALLDAYRAHRWVLDNASQLGCDATRRVVVGESSGATLAAGLSLLLRDNGAPPFTYQVLVYPVTDDAGRWPSYHEHGDGYILDRQQAGWFLGHYLPETYDSSDPYLFPLRAGDLSRLPSTFVLTAEFDPLRDEGTAFATALKHAGVDVVHEHVPDQMHGFLMLSRVSARAEQLLDGIADRLASRGCTGVGGSRELS